MARRIRPFAIYFTDHNPRLFNNVKKEDLDFFRHFISGLDLLIAVGEDVIRNYQLNNVRQATYETLFVNLISARDQLAEDASQGAVIAKLESEMEELFKDVNKEIQEDFGYIPIETEENYLKKNKISQKKKENKE